MNARISGHRHGRIRYVWVAVLLLAVIACRGINVTQYFERGVLATAAPVATEVGQKVFAEGGNAFDVAVAVGFVLAVAHPEAGNIGGGGFAVIRTGADGKVKALDFRETAPSAATETMYLNDSGEVIDGLSTLGAKAVGVPGTVAGLHELWRQHGSLPWEQLVGYAAALADTGFVVDEYLAASFADYREDLNDFEETALVFYPGGKTLTAGDRLVQEDLAATMYTIAANGRNGFYEGTVAEYITECMTMHGGLITADDLRSYQPIWREPIHFEFDSLDIYSMPPPSSGGVLVAQILKILEPYDFSEFAPDSPEFIHLFCEASRLAFADRSEHFGDPDFYPVPVALLLDNTYLAQRRSLISPEHASSPAEISPGYIPGEESEQTTHYSVCDRDGNMVSITYTLNAAYGSKLVVDGAGFLLNNEMDDFSAKPGAPNIYGLVGARANRIEPGKRMLSSMSPTLVLNDGKPFMSLGAPGGGKIITVVAQAIINSSRFAFTPRETVSQPRMHHQWLPDILYLEEGGFDTDVRQGLIRFGHNVQERSVYSDLQMILVTPDGLMTGASDPRGRGIFGGL